jgi:hypothetical protein
MIEKHGALWVADPEAGLIVFEQVDRSRGLLAIVFQRPDGLFTSAIFERCGDPQWSLPVWSERRPEALFDRLGDAKEHVTVILGK